MGFIIALMLVSADAPQVAVEEQSSEMAVSVKEPSRAEKMAPLISLVLPGTGELIRGYKLKGELFLWADGLAITGAAGFGWDAGNKRSASVTMAVMYAGASASNRSRDYLGALERFASSDAYNLDVAREARSVYPEDFTAQQEYIASHSFTGDDEWEWSSDSLWDEYIAQRILMRKASQASTAFMGIMLLTRVASVMDVAFFSPVGKSRVGFVPIPDPYAPGVGLVYRF
jgi:hypothetical protein